MRKVYLSGPMTGIEFHNYPLFNRVAAQLREEGVFVYNPAEFTNDPEHDFNVREAFAAYCKFICEEADTVVILPGWHTSAGARVEVALARRLGLQIATVKGLEY